MVTTTTKTLNYSIIRGNHTNSVNATITSTPGFNVNYFGKIPGILKVIELVVTVVALGLAASRRAEVPFMVQPYTDNWRIEYFLTGEVFFLCVMSTGLMWLFAILVTYAAHIVSSVITPKTTIHEVVFNFLFMLMYWVAGIVELAETVPNAYGRPYMNTRDWGCRIAAGSLALFIGTFFLISFAMAVKELQGPKRSAPITASPVTIVTVVALGLVASRRREGPVGTIVNTFNPSQDVYISWPIEYFLAGEVFFLCICAAGLTYLFGQLTTFAWSVVSSVLIPKTTYFEMVINLLLFLAWATAGIVELAMTSREGWNNARTAQELVVFDANGNAIPTNTRIANFPNYMMNPDWGCRIAGGSLALFLAVFHLVSFVLAVQEFTGPRNNQA